VQCSLAICSLFSTRSCGSISGRGPIATSLASGGTAATTVTSDTTHIKNSLISCLSIGEGRCPRAARGPGRARPDQPAQGYRRRRQKPRGHPHRPLHQIPRQPRLSKEPNVRHTVPASAAGGRRSRMLRTWKSVRPVKLGALSLNSGCDLLGIGQQLSAQRTNTLRTESLCSIWKHRWQGFFMSYQ
jgi:hypothetical protein